jgi:hypothetical protein
MAELNGKRDWAAGIEIGQRKGESAHQEKGQEKGLARSIAM